MKKKDNSGNSDNSDNSQNSDNQYLGNLIYIISVFRMKMSLVLLQMTYYMY